MCFPNGALKPRPKPVHEGSETPPNALGRGSRFATHTTSLQAIFRRRRHQPRRPPLAKIRPGRPAPATGPGTACGVMVPEKPVSGWINPTNRSAEDNTPLKAHQCATHIEPTGYNIGRREVQDQIGAPWIKGN